MQPIVQIDIYGTDTGEEDEDHLSPGGFGAVIRAAGREYRVTGGAPRTDIGDMTMTAAAKALRTVKWIGTPANARVELRTSFGYMVDMFKSPPHVRHGWLVPLWKEILAEAAPMDVRFITVSRADPACRQIALDQLETARNSKNPYNYYSSD